MATPRKAAAVARMSLWVWGHATKAFVCGNAIYAASQGRVAGGQDAERTQTPRVVCLSQQSLFAPSGAGVLFPKRDHGEFSTFNWLFSSITRTKQRGQQPAETPFTRQDCVCCIGWLWEIKREENRNHVRLVGVTWGLDNCLQELFNRYLLVYRRSKQFKY